VSDRQQVSARSAWSDFPAIARAQFELIRPTRTFVQTGFVRPEFRVQMEVDAVVDVQSPG